MVGSDTLFAALVHAANMLGAAEAFISAAKEKRLLLSSLFAESANNKCLLPAIMPDGLAWQEAEGPVAPLLHRDRPAAPLPPERRRRAAIDRLTLAANPFSEMLQRVEVARFWIGIDPLLEEDLLASIHLLEDAGIGGGRSVGYGRFVCLERREILDPRAFDGRGRLLSLAVPASPTEENIVQEFALWVDRNGYTEEAYRRSPNRRRVGLWALAEGAEVPASLQGTVTVLDSQHGLVHYGLALVARCVP